MIKEGTHRKSRHGRWILFILFCSAIATWTIRPEYKQQKIYQHSAAVGVIELSPDRSHMATLCEKGVLRMWEVNSGQLLWSRDTEHTDWYSEGLFAFSPQGPHLALAGHEPGEILLLDIHSGAVIERETFEDTGEVLGVGYSPDGNYRAALGERGNLILTSLATQATEQTSLKFRLTRAVKIVFSPDGDRLAVFGDVSLFTVSLKSKEVEMYPYMLAPPLAVSPNLNKFAAPGVDSTILLGDLFTMEFDGQLGSSSPHRPGHEIFFDLSAVAFSPDSRFLAASFRSRSVGLWDLSSSQPIGLLECETVRCISLLDNKSCAVGLGDGRVIIGEFQEL